MVCLQAGQAFLVAGWEVLMEIQVHQLVVVVLAVVAEVKAYCPIAVVDLLALQVVDMGAGIVVDIYDPIVLPVP